eukprot:Lithocolla_globosa_v1_NODE_606_length_3612_cov_5.933652.p1 type:complete len:926 gc:universal NODE_606_length_3612_cov_5.933652:2939-162(-)
MTVSPDKKIKSKKKSFSIFSGSIHSPTRSEMIAILFLALLWVCGSAQEECDICEIPDTCGPCLNGSCVAAPLQCGGGTYGSCNEDTGNCDCNYYSYGAQCDRGYCVSEDSCATETSDSHCARTIFDTSEPTFVCDVRNLLFEDRLQGTGRIVTRMQIEEGTCDFNLLFRNFSKLYEYPNHFDQVLFCKNTGCSLTTDEENYWWWSCDNLDCTCDTDFIECNEQQLMTASMLIKYSFKVIQENEDTGIVYADWIDDGLPVPVGLECTVHQCGEFEPYVAPEVTVIESSAGAIAGAVGGALIVLISVFVGTVFFVRKQQNKVIEKILADQVEKTAFAAVGGHNVQMFTFSDLGYRTPDYKGSIFRLRRDRKLGKKVLHEVSGVVKGGEMMCIMGASGAGKSTCLDILAMRNKTGTVTGNIMVDGEHITGSQMKKVSGYVDQAEALLPFLTVREAAIFAARLQLPRDMSDEEKLRRVEAVLFILEIDHVATSQIGSKGLDAYNAGVVAECLGKLASKTNTVVIAAVHQPRAEVFQAFHKLLLLAHGHMIYSSATADAIDYFAQMGHRVPSYFNPADFYIDIAARLASDLDEKSENRKASGLAAEFKSSSFMPDLNSPTSSSSSSSSLPSSSSPSSSSPSREPITWWQQFNILTSRAFMNLYRDPTLLLGHYATAAAMGLLFGLVFFQLDQTLSGFQNRQGFIFFTLSFFGFSSLSILELFETEKTVYIVERANGWYRASSYFVSKSILDNIGLRLVPPIILCSISYYMAGFYPTTERFLKFLLVVILVNMAESAYVLGLVAWGSKAFSRTLGSLVILMHMMMCGMLVNKDELPAWLAWIVYLNPMYYAFEALVTNEMNGFTITQEVNGQLFRLDADKLLDKFGFDLVSCWFYLYVETYWRNVAMLCGFVVLLTTNAFVSLAYRIKEKR